MYRVRLARVTASRARTELSVSALWARKLQRHDGSEKRENALYELLWRHIGYSDVTWMMRVSVGHGKTVVTAVPDEFGDMEIGDGEDLTPRERAEGYVDHINAEIRAGFLNAAPRKVVAIFESLD